MIGRLGLAPVVLAIAGCANATPPAAPSVAANDLTVFAAASLSGALAAAETAYEAAVSGTTLTISTDSSSALETQIEQGAPADVFLAADPVNPRKLVDAGLAHGDAVVFAANELAVIVPKGNPASIGSPADLARNGVKVIAAGDEVPITTYATRLLADLAKDPAYPPDFAARYAANVVSKEDNVKAVVAKVGLGEGDAAIVYATDVTASSEVESVDVPDAANVRASYAGVVIKASSSPDEAAAFLAWLAGAGGQAILGQAGFLPPR